MKDLKKTFTVSIYTENNIGLLKASKATAASAAAAAAASASAVPFAFEPASYEDGGAAAAEAIRTPC